MVKLITITLLTGITLLSGCAQDNSRDSIDDDQKEFILTKVNNQKGLIEFYRNKLQKNEDEKIRYKLAERYYEAEDYESSDRYLKPLLNSQSDENILLLAARDNLEMGKLEEAMQYVSRILDINVKNGEAWNLQGILLAQKGDFTGAYRAYDKARQLFVDDQIVVNNIAMSNIMQGNYAAARDNLLNLYRTGNSNQQIKHNLVYVFVKLQDFTSAEAVLQEMSSQEEATELLESLASIDPAIKNNTILHTSIVSTNRPLAVSQGTAIPIIGSNSGKKKGGNKDQPVMSNALTGASFLKPVVTTSSVKTEQRPASNPSLTKLKKIVFNVIPTDKSELMLTLSSSYEINYQILTKKNDHNFSIVLLNCELNDFLANRVQALMGKYGVVNATASQYNKTDILLSIEFNDLNKGYDIVRIPRTKNKTPQLAVKIKHDA